MSTTEMRQAVHSYIDQLDEKFLKAILAMVEAYMEQEDPILGYRVDTREPVRAAQAEDEFEQILDEVKQGDYMTIEDLIKEKSASW